MSESKAFLREDRDLYKGWYEDERNRRQETELHCREELDEADKLHAETVAFHQLKYLDLAKAVVDVYGIGVDTLLKAHQYKLKQARDGELMDAYTEAISVEPNVSVKSEPKGKN